MAKVKLNCSVCQIEFDRSNLPLVNDHRREMIALALMDRWGLSMSEVFSLIDAQLERFSLFLKRKLGS